MHYPEADRSNEEHPARRSERQLMGALQSVAVWGFAIHQVKDLKDLLRVDLDYLLRILQENGVVPVKINLETATQESRIELDLGCSFNAFMDALPERLQFIAAERTLAINPRTLEELGDHFGISRQRVGQLESTLKDALQTAAGAQFQRAGSILRAGLGPVVAQPALESCIHRLLLGIRAEYASVAAKLLQDEAGYELRSGYAFSSQFTDIVEQVRKLRDHFVDPEGVVDVAKLAKVLDIPPKVELGLLLEEAAFKRVLGAWVERDTNKVRIILALRNINEPSTPEEIAAFAKIAVSSVRGALSSASGVVRITKDNWGLEGWTDDPYDGVVGEIVQRIEEGGGGAALQELLDDIPRRFGVSRTTVQTYLSTPKFVVKDEWVELARDLEFRLKPLPDVPGVFWTTDNTPVYRVQAELAHLQGNSVKIPREVAQRLGLRPDESTTIKVHKPAGCDPISAIWRAHDPTGPELGRLRIPLEAIGVQPGQDVFIALESDGVTIADQFDGLRDSPTSEHGQISADQVGEDAQKLADRAARDPRAKAVLDRIKARRNF